MSEGAFGDDGNAYAKEFLKQLRLRSVHKSDPVPEWTVEHATVGDTNCICTKAITNMFYIVNKLNGNNCYIGSDCVKRWNIKCVKTCTSCNSPLGNITMRMLKKDFTCPECKRSEKKRTYEEALELEQKLLKIGRFKLFWRGPWYELKFADVIKNIDWVNHLMNIESNSKSLTAFQEYCNGQFTFKEIPE